MKITSIFRLQPQWNRAIADAEKLVGYTGSFLSLQCLLTDEMAQLALNARKLFSRQQHPLFKTARTLFNGRSNVVQTWGLTVLLMSRTANCSVERKRADHPTDEIFSNQRSLAEIVELICTANFVHKGLVDKEEHTIVVESPDSKRDITLGNKLAVLGGDFLLANASVALSKLRHTNVVNDVAQAIGDMSTAEFLGEPSNLEQLHRKLFFASGSILANSCRASLRLANHSEAFLESSFNFGKNFAIAFELNRLVKLMRENHNAENSNSTQIAVDSELFPSNLLEKSMREFSDRAIDELNIFKESDARNSLTEMAQALGHM